MIFSQKRKFLLPIKKLTCAMVKTLSNKRRYMGLVTARPTITSCLERHFPIIIFLIWKQRMAAPGCLMIRPAPLSSTQARVGLQLALPKALHSILPELVTRFPPMVVFWHLTVKSTKTQLRKCVMFFLKSLLPRPIVKKPCPYWPKRKS